MKLPKKVDLTALAGTYADLDEWAGDNETLISNLVLCAAERLYSQDLDTIVLVEFTYNNETLFDLILNRESAEETLELNERFWVDHEEYGLAARARDAREKLKRAEELGNPAD